MGRPKGKVSKSTTTVSITTSLLDAARQADFSPSEVLEEALRARLDPSTYAQTRIAELRGENEDDIARLAQLKDKVAARDEEIRKLENLFTGEEMARVIRKIRGLIGWDFDADVAEALEMCKSEGLDAEYQEVAHKPLDLETLSVYVRMWSFKKSTLV